MSFGEKLRNAREKCGMTQQQVADAMQIDKSTYCGYETGKRQPDVQKIKMLSQILGVSGDELLETGYEKASTSEGEREVSNYDLKVALFGGDSEVTDEMWEEAVFAAQMIKERYRRKKEQK